jgi:hypothetical protein
MGVEPRASELFQRLQRHQRKRCLLGIISGGPSASTCSASHCVGSQAAAGIHPLDRRWSARSVLCWACRDDSSGLCPRRVGSWPGISIADLSGLGVDRIRASCRDHLLCLCRSRSLHIAGASRHYQRPSRSAARWIDASPRRTVDIACHDSRLWASQNILCSCTLLT